MKTHVLIDDGGHEYTMIVKGHVLPLEYCQKYAEMMEREPPALESVRHRWARWIPEPRGSVFTRTLRYEAGPARGVFPLTENDRDEP